MIGRKYRKRRRRHSDGVQFGTLLSPLYVAYFSLTYPISASFPRMRQRIGAIFIFYIHVGTSKFQALTHDLTVDNILLGALPADEERRRFPDRRLKTTKKPI